MTPNDPRPGCLACRYHIEIKHPQNIGQSIYECRRHPPIALMVPQQTPQGPQLVAMFTHPQVSREQWCFSFEPISAANDAPLIQV